jgi:hypothetical protein
MTATTSTATCGCGTLLATWDPRLHQWLPPLGEATRIHDTRCELQQQERRTA